MRPICKCSVGGTCGKDNEMAVGPTVSPLKIKNKEKIFLWHY
jgi:hypothetical protein